MTTREKVDKINKKILRLNENLGEIRSACKHKNIETINYSYRPGAICPAALCKDCDEVIETDFDLVVKNKKQINK